MKRNLYPLCPLIFTILLGLLAVVASAQPLAPSPDLEPVRETGPVRGGEPCAGGVIPDDGTAETGYGWVPSVLEGEYVQRFHSGMFPTRALETVCICWLRTTNLEIDIDFELIFYEDEEGRPAATPYATVPSNALVEAKGVVATFFEVDVTGIDIPVGPSYIGARWDASVDRFFFICVDEGDETEPVEVFFRDEQAEGEWASVFESNDPIFNDHKALMIRATSDLRGPTDIPSLGIAGLVMLALGLAGAALGAMRRRDGSG